MKLTTQACMHDSATVVTAIKNTQQQLLYNYNMTIQQYPNTQIRLPGFLFGGAGRFQSPLFQRFRVSSRTTTNNTNTISTLLQSQWHYLLYCSYATNYEHGETHPMIPSRSPLLSTQSLPRALKATEPAASIPPPNNNPVCTTLAYLALLRFQRFLS